MDTRKAIWAILCLNILLFVVSIMLVSHHQSKYDVTAEFQGDHRKFHFEERQTTAGDPARTATFSSSFIAGDGSAFALHNPAIVLFCYNRTTYLSKTLESLAGLVGLDQFTLYISQDGHDANVSQLVEHLGRTILAPPISRGFVHWEHGRVPLISLQQKGHAWLTQHYKWGLDRVFLEQNHSHVIIVEDDMLFSPDFLSYFRATAVLLEADPSLWCISSWNDNGLSKFDWDSKHMLRTSYFPGLGWMMRRELWLELGPIWPLDNWDHWMRLETTAKGRECIAPDVNRNKNIGEVGANMDKRVFKRYLMAMSWNQQTVNDYGNLAYLLHESYQTTTREAIDSATPIDWSNRQAFQTFARNATFLVPYKIEEYTKVAARFGTWPFPRGHFQHVTFIPFMGSRFLLVDKRFSPFIPDEDRISPTVGLRSVRAQRNQNCVDACKAQNLGCSQDDFWFINSCEELKKHFPCEKGCTVELGPDIPNYVMDPSLDTFQMCLVTQMQPRCPARHKATARLCACVELSRLTPSAVLTKTPVLTLD